jgi:hypothetical protein
MSEMDLIEAKVAYQKIRIDNPAAFNTTVGKKKV